MLQRSYGGHDLAANTGWVSVGTDHDTAAFAVATIASWWEHVGKALHPSAVRLLVSADGGGSNGYRIRLWKTELAALATRQRLTNLIECNVLGVIVPSILAPRMPTSHCRPLR